MKNFKKVIALGLASTMVLGCGITAFAAPTTADSTSDVEITGDGVELLINKNVMSVTLPTTLTNILDYRVDPQGLVKESMSYKGTAIEGINDTTGVLFLNTDASGKKTVSNYSDVVKITNESSIPVEITIKTTLTDAASGLASATVMADSADFSTDANKTKALYLGMQATNDSLKALAGGSTGVNFDNILLSGADQYEVKNTSGDTYTYTAKQDAKFADFEFVVTGAINKNLPDGTWATIDGDTGAVSAIKNPPSIKVAFQLKGVRNAHEGGAGFIGDDLYFWNPNAADLATDGGFGTTAPTISINGKAVTADTNVAGYACVKFDKIAARFGYTDVTKMTDAEKAAVKGYVKAVKAVTGSGATEIIYYAEIK